MDGCCKSPVYGKPSAKHRSKPLEGSTLEVADFSDEVHVRVSSDHTEHPGENSTANFSEILSTPVLISAVGQIWHSANRSLALLQPKTNIKQSDTVCWRDDVLLHFGGEDKSPDLASGTSSTNLKPSTYCLQEHGLEGMRLSHKILSKHCTTSSFDPFLFRGLHDFPFVRNDSSPKRLAEISYDLRKIYGWMNQVYVYGPKLPGRYNHENRETIQRFDSADITAACTTPGGNEISVLPDEPRAENAASCHVDRSRDSPFSVLTEICGDATESVSSLYSNTGRDASMQAIATRVSTSGCPVNISSSDCTFGQDKYKVTDDDLSDGKNKYEELDAADQTDTEIHSPKVNRIYHVHAKREHAVSGALAGTFVSLCLHPVDTVKTIVQSCQADQKSILAIVRSIVSVRGLTGLYRGIASNITTSAPISAIYTSTYEMVKGSLLPLLPKEYQSLAHCTAGGCASIATSFVFTPSERIKQQMQISSNYQNCWNALLRILEKGGLPSLYAGWGAVLCRNIPHSIIKFYTYESLKQLIVSQKQPNTQPDALQTLLCGGLAGSTAALFSTPFDVVKTRLQTQIPGSTGQYRGVFVLLQEISRHEGIKGLYRGLTPRLIMYMSQGALFFSSYELFKSLVCLKLPQPSSVLEYESELDDGSMLSLSPSQ